MPEYYFAHVAKGKKAKGRGKEKGKTTAGSRSATGSASSGSRAEWESTNADPWPDWSQTLDPVAEAGWRSAAGSDMGRSQDVGEGTWSTGESSNPQQERRWLQKDQEYGGYRPYEHDIRNIINASSPLAFLLATASAGASDAAFAELQCQVHICTRQSVDVPLPASKYTNILRMFFALYVPRNFSVQFCFAREKVCRCYAGRAAGSIVGSSILLPGIKLPESSHCIFDAVEVCTVSEMDRLLLDAVADYKKHLSLIHI